MKIVQINTVPNGSTGSIMMSIHKSLQEDGIESYVVWGRGRKSNNKYEINMNDKIGVYLHFLYSRIMGKTGFGSRISTRKLLKKLDSIKPDIVHLHNIHGYYINIEMLFNYLKYNNIKTIWTLHDCWAFTGNCSHFQYIKCDKWMKECNNCPQRNIYPKTLIDNSNWCYLKKKNIFTGMKNLTIVTPSTWLANLVKLSFLNKYKIQVINNGIDTSLFRKIEKDKDKFKKIYNLENKNIILGVASPWTNKKGLQDFIELSKIIDDKYKIVLVGLNDKQINNIPSNILGLKRTNSIEELVEIYNSAEVFINPSYEENYPTTNLESISCGTPIIIYNAGGSHESAFIDKNNPNCIKIDDLNKNVQRLKEIIEKKLYKTTSKVKVKKIDKKYMVEEYKKIYFS